MKNPSNTAEEDSFRDHFSSVDDYGKRVWFYPQKPRGKWHNRRVVFTIVLLALMFSGPFIRVGGNPLFLFNILERKFFIFGIFIGPQDYWIFGLLMLSFLVFVSLFTNLFGRLWCGWACPQTVFMEMVFRKIEYAIEGDWNKQKALDRAPWDTSKIVKKGSKWAIFVMISFLIANLLLAYLVGVDELKKIVTHPVSDNPGLFAGVVIFTLIFFFIFSWLRDQACTVVCPYGRLQGVLLDKKSAVVAYDHVRGEQRGKLRKGQERELGDCIDCFQCVRVCPTGIDIRNGTQMECVSCTACIDACDHMMDQVGFERGLIRYASEETINSGKKEKKLSLKTVGYSIVLLALWGGLAYAMLTRSSTETTLLRVPGTRFIENPDGTISNLYNFKIYNKTNAVLKPQLRLLGKEGSLRFAGVPDLTLQPAGSVQGTLFIAMPREALKGRKNYVPVAVFQQGEMLESFETTLMGP
ncbi:cytochrome c oxidase accessory protein CcoG [Ravibacter arvi]|uniref:Cytochrome c oxidase accessory protein CcoG n=1 Tax=Ravibacter arvi TaxID=2051041 RepID=A0ABP8M1G6_9BACT